MRQPRMGSTEWGSQEVGSPQRRGTAGRHALSRSLQEPEAAPAGKSAGRKRELAAHNLVRPGTCSCPEAREERAEKEKKDSGFPSHPGLPGECQHSRAGSRADGCPGDGTGEHPRCLSGDILPGARQEPCNVAGKGGNCMADKAVDPQYPSCPQHIQAPSEPREMHRAGPPGDDTLRMKGSASRPSLRIRRLSAPEAVSGQRAFPTVKKRRKKVMKRMAQNTGSSGEMRTEP